MVGFVLEALEGRSLLSAFTVVNTNDSGPGSLRQAVLDSNQAPGADVVTFHAGLAGLMIPLFSGELSVTGPLSITGLGMQLSGVSGSNASRVFNVAPGGALTISGLTITGGSAPQGGGIYNGGSLTVASCSVSGNGASGNGGAIYNAGSGPLTLNGVELVQNVSGSGHGGALFTASTSPVTIQGSTFYLNSSTNGNGGAVFSASGTLAISSSTLDSNVAISGGGVFVSGGSLTLTDSLLKTNAATGFAEQGGGGIAFAGTSLSVQGSTFNDNKANTARGGGVQVKAGTATVAASLFEENWSDALAGAGISIGPGQAAVSGTTLRNNHGTGLTAFLGSNVSVVDSSFTGNVATGIANTNGVVSVLRTTLSGNALGGIDNTANGVGSVLTVTDSTISFNPSVGIYNSHQSTLTVIGSTISDNDDDGIRHDGGVTSVVNSTVTRNGDAKAGYGIVLNNGGTISVRNSTIAGNFGNGLALYAGSASLVSTILAGNVGGDIFSAGLIDNAASRNNLVQNGPGSLAIGSNGNFLGNPLLGPLAANGGPTKTMALGAGSPAINAGFNPAPALTTDQRGTGFPRQAGAGPDIGAVEFFVAPTLVSVGASGASVGRGQPLTLTANGAADADGPVAAVRFYRDLNANAAAEDGELIGTDSAPDNGFSLLYTVPGASALGSASFLAVAIDGDGAVSPTRSVSVSIVNSAPVIGSLTPAPATALRGQTVTLTANATIDVDGTVSQVQFYLDTNTNGVADAGESLGIDTDGANGYSFTYVVPAGAALGTVTFLAVATDSDNAISGVKAGALTVALPPADQFIEQYAVAPKAASGLVDGDWIADSLKGAVANVATSDAYWGARNHWFQDSHGDVWALWNGGPVHNSTTLSGQHEWVLTNLTDAAGLSGTMQFAAGSLSGITTGWNAFNIQGVQNGALFALWWSPEGSAGDYVDTDGSTRHGKGWGVRGNGWSLSSIAAASTPIGGAIATPPAAFLPYSESQGNGRTEFDPRPARAIANTGMSVVMVDVNHRVFVVTFSVAQRPIPGARPDLNGSWIVEPLAEVPSLGDLGLTAQTTAFENAYVAAAGG